MSDLTVGSTQLQLVAPTIPDLPAHIGPLERQVAALVVNDLATHAMGQELGRRLTSLRKFVEQVFDDPKKKAHAAHKSITQAEAKMLIPVTNTLSLLNGKLTTYERQEKARAEQEAREREAEARRQEEERQIAEAVAADVAGDKDLAGAILEAPVIAPAVVVTPAFAEVAGSSKRENWKAEIVDFPAFARWCVATEQFDLLEANQTALNGRARSAKSNLKIPGVRSVDSTVRSYKGA